MTRPVFIFAVFCCCIVAPACKHPDYRAILPNGYSVYRLDGATVIIVDSGDNVIIAAKVDKIKVVGNVVVGLVVDSPDVQAVGPHSVGYFFLDTTSGYCRKGLTLREWERELDSAGMARGVKLVSPRELPRRED